MIITDGKRMPISIGDISQGNHNDLYHIAPSFSTMTKEVNNKNICVQNNILNAYKGFDSNRFRWAFMRINMVPHIKNRKTKKRGKKRFYNDEIYKTRFVNERCFAWIDSFRTLLVRFDKTDKHWLDWHYLAFALKYY